MYKAAITLLLLASAPAATGSAAPRTVTASNSPIRSDIHLADGRALSYLHWSAPGKPVLLLLHGKGGYATSFADLAAHFAGRYDLYALDMRGRGYSGWAKDGDYTVEATVADTAAFVQALGLRRFGLYGHSYGAVVALAFAARHDAALDFLILEDGGPTVLPDGRPAPLNPGQTASAGAPARAPDPLHFESWEAARAWQAGHCTFQCTEAQLDSSFVRDSSGHVAERNDGPGIDRSPRGDAFTNQWPAVRAVTTRTLVLRAERGLLPEPITIAMHAANPRIAYVTIPGAVHALRASQPARAYAAIEAFLRQ